MTRARTDTATNLVAKMFSNAPANLSQSYLTENHAPGCRCATEFMSVGANPKAIQALAPMNSPLDSKVAAEDETPADAVKIFQDLTSQAALLDRELGVAGTVVEVAGAAEVPAAAQDEHAVSLAVKTLLPV